MTAALAPFEHPALLYRDSAGYLAGTVPFIRDGLSGKQPVMVAVPGANLELIRAALGRAGGDCEQVRWHDMSVAGSNPGRIIPGVLHAFATEHPGTRVRIIGEPIWAGRSELEYPACAQHEALINVAFAGREATILCPYDVSRLEQRVIDDAYRTHPVLVEASNRWASPAFGDPTTVAESFNQPLPEPPSDCERVPIQALSGLRRSVATRGAAAGLSADRVDDLILVVNELATNSIEHSGRPGTVALWSTDREVICQVIDGGHITDPMAGRLPPTSFTALGGRGLVLVNEVCDLVRIHTRPGATTIQVHLTIG